jgi:hypothetical protein
MQPIPTPSPRRWANREVARELDRHGRRWLWRLVAGVVIVSAPGVAWQLAQNECLRLGYASSALREKRDRLEEEARRLRARREELRSLAAIETWAARNGLVQPSPEHVVVVAEAAERSDMMASNVDRLPLGD